MNFVSLHSTQKPPFDLSEFVHRISFNLSIFEPQFLLDSKSENPLSHRRAFHQFEMRKIPTSFLLVSLQFKQALSAFIKDSHNAFPTLAISSFNCYFIGISDYAMTEPLSKLFHTFGQLSNPEIDKKVKTWPRDTMNSFMN